MFTTINNNSFFPLETPSLNLPLLGLTPSLGKRHSPPLCRWLSSAKFGIKTSSQLSSSRSLRKRKCPWPCLEMERVCIRMERSPGIWWVGWPVCKRSCNAMDCPTQRRIFALKISVVLPLKKYRTAWKIYTSEGQQTKLIPSTGQRGEASKIRSHQYLLRVSGDSAWRGIWLPRPGCCARPHWALAAHPGTASAPGRSGHSPATGAVTLARLSPFSAVDLLLPEQTSLLGGLQFLSVANGETRFYKLTLLTVNCSADNESLKWESAICTRAVKSPSEVGRFGGGVCWTGKILPVLFIFLISWQKENIPSQALNNSRGWAKNLT